MIYSDDDVDPVNTKSNLQSTKKLGLTRKNWLIWSLLKSVTSGRNSSIHGQGALVQPEPFRALLVIFRLNSRAKNRHNFLYMRNHSLQVKKSREFNLVIVSLETKLRNKLTQLKLEKSLFTWRHPYCLNNYTLIVSNLIFPSNISNLTVVIFEVHGVLIFDRKWMDL